MTISQIVFDPTIGLASQVKPSSFLLIDEADFILLDGCQTVVNKNVVGLSATAFNDSLAYERDFIESQGFVCRDSHLKGYIDPNATKSATLQEFCAKSAGFAKLIFAQGDACTALNCCPEHISATDCYDLKRLQNLTSKDVLVVTDAALMRGVDYRV